MNRLLLIEDDDIARCVNMQEVTNLQEHDFHIVLTDLSLPDSDYAETFFKVQAKFGYIPIIVLTSFSELDFAIKTIQNGAQDYLVKGDFDGKILEKAIHYAVERKKIANDYTRIFNESPVPMYVFDSTTYKFLSVNTAALDQYGYTKEEFLALSAYDIRPKEDIQAFNISTANKTALYQDLGQLRHLKKSGEIFFVQVYAHNTWLDGKNAWITSAINIDNKVIAENALIKKTKETENILESITDSFFTLNNDWQFTYVNKESEKTLRHTKEELLGRSIWDIFPEIKRSKFWSEYHRAKKEKISVHFEETFPLLGIWLSVNAYPTEDGITVYFVDVTEQRNHLNMIEEQNNRLREIAWIQSHEVRGPVASILGLIQIFNVDNPADPINKEVLNNIKEATDKLDEITRRITAHTFIGKL